MTTDLLNKTTIAQVLKKTTINMMKKMRENTNKFNFNFLQEQIKKSPMDLIFIFLETNIQSHS